jgi:hypothetical protein
VVASHNTKHAPADANANAPDTPAQGVEYAYGSYDKEERPHLWDGATAVHGAVIL